MFDLKKIIMCAFVISSAECHALATTTAFAQEVAPAATSEASAPAPAPAATPEASSPAPAPAVVVCLIGAHPGMNEADAHTATMLICHELRKQGVPVGDPTYEAPASATVYRSAFHRLGEKILIRLSQESPAGSIVLDRQLMLAKIEEVTAAAPRLVDALVHRKTIQSTITVENVVEADAPARRKKTGEFLWSIGLFGTFVPGTDILAKPGMEMGGFYETESYAVGTQFRFTGGEQGQDSFAHLSFGIGGRYFFNNRNLTPYVGGGLAWSTLGYESEGVFEDDAETGLGAYAVAGMEFLRLYESRMMLELRIDAPLFQLHSGSESKYIVPVTLGISYAW